MQHLTLSYRRYLYHNSSSLTWRLTVQYWLYYTNGAAYGVNPFPNASVCATTVYYILHYNLADLSDDLPQVVSLLTCLMISPR